MKKFKFQLATLLKVTKMKKEQAEIEFAEATAQLLQAQEVLRAMQEEVRQGMEHYYQLAAQTVTVAQLMSYSSYFTRMKTREENQRQAIEQARSHREARLEVLKAAMGKLKTIEQLRERRFIQFRELELAEEQKSLDEIGLQIYTRMVR